MGDDEVQLRDAAEIHHRLMSQCSILRPPPTRRPPSRPDSHFPSRIVSVYTPPVSSQIFHLIFPIYFTPSLVNQSARLPPTMAQNCPHCGTDLGLVLARNSPTGTPATGNASTQQRAPEFDSSKAHIVRIKNLMCAPLQEFDSRMRHQTMRPVISDRDVVGALKDVYARETMGRVAKKMQATIHAGGEPSVDSLVETRRCGRRKNDSRCSPEHVFEAIGAIIYAMEWTGGELRVDKDVIVACATTVPQFVQVPLNRDALPRLLELMLVVDYGFPPFPIHGSLAWSELQTFCGFLVAIAWRWRQQQAVPGNKEWDHISFAACFWSIEEVSVWDVTTMLYYYQIHREPVAAEERKQGWTGYTGVLQEMTAEVYIRGKDRLERKLSLDAHLLIPRYVRDWKLRTQMISVVQDLAARHGCQLAPPEMPRPPIWWRWFNWLRNSLGDEEKDPEKKRLLEP